MEQRSEEWFEWRSKGIGASEAPIIMGASPWKTAHELFLERTGKKKPDKKTTARQQRGIDMERVARAYYELETGLEFPDATFEDPELSYLKCSLDGWNERLKIILEIKCPGPKDHITAINGAVPDKYIWQLYHQLMVTRADRCDYFSFDGVKGAVVKVFPDDDMIGELRRKEILFWKCIQTKRWEDFQ